MSYGQTLARLKRKGILYSWVTFCPCDFTCHLEGSKHPCSLSCWSHDLRGFTAAAQAAG